MASRSDQQIGFRAAAELIFRTRRPHAQQVQRVRELVESGEQAGTSRGTTPETVAQLLSRAARQRSEKAGSQTSPSPPRRAEDGAHGEVLANMYQQTLKDFFLAVILRRRVLRGCCGASQKKGAAATGSRSSGKWRIGDLKQAAHPAGGALAGGVADEKVGVARTS